MSSPIPFENLDSRSYGTRVSQAAFLSSRLLAPRGRGILTFIASSTALELDGNLCAIDGVKLQEVERQSGSQMSLTIKLSITLRSMSPNLTPTPNPLS